MGFYIGIYLLLVFLGICTTSGLFLPSYIKWIVFPRNCWEIFSKQIDFSKISFVVQERKIIYLSFYGFSLILYLIFVFLYLYFCWLIFNIPEYYHWKFAIPLIVTFILFQLFFSFTCWKFWKKLSIKITTKKVAIANFLDFKQNWKETKTLTIADFRIEILSQDQGFHNQAFQLHQEKLIREMIELHEKKITPDIFNYKSLQIFISYIEKNAWQIKYLKKQYVRYNIWIDDNLAELDDLKIALINNFLIFENENITHH